MDYVGQKLGNYQIVRLIGHGGFADVYLGEHIYLQTRAAIKVLNTRVGPEQMQSFLNEAQIIARLNHPHIIRVLEFGLEQATPYLVMEYAPNGTMRQLLPRQARLPLSLVVAYTRQIASALQHAHEQHLIHRDVKPENLLLTSKQEIVLSDFGISAIVPTSQSLSTQTISGTISYMAPEQIQGRPRQASDQYSLAIVVYEWLTGRCPFTGTFVEVASNHIYATPPSPRIFFAEIPAEIEEVLFTALAKSPEARFQRITAFAYALEQAAQEQLRLEDATYYSQGPTMPGAQYLAPQVLAAKTPLATPERAGIQPTVVNANAQLTPPNGQATFPTAISTPVPPLVPAKGSQFSRRTVLSGLSATAVVVGGGAVALWQLLHSNPKPGSAHNVGSPTSAPGATHTAGSTVQPTTAPTNQPTSAPTNSQPVALQAIVHQQGTAAVSVSWHPSGNRVASCGSGPLIQIWNPANGQTLSTLNTGQQLVEDVEWSPNGLFLASAHADGTAAIWDTTLNQRHLLLTGQHRDKANFISWSPDGSRIATAGGDKIVVIWDASNGNALQIYRGHSHYVNTVHWSPDGSQVASGGGDTTVQIWDPNSGLTLNTFRGHVKEVNTLAWSPDGSRIVSGSSDTLAYVWSTQTTQLAAPPYRGHSSFVVSVSWSPDGRRIVSGGGDHTQPSTDTSAQVWDPNTSQRLAIYTAHHDEIERVVWSPDSQRIATASDDTTVQIWQPHS